jgi:hypothetical protein
MSGGRRAAYLPAIAVVLALALVVTAVTAFARTSKQSTRSAADWLARDEVRGGIGDYPGVQADAVGALYAARRAGAGVTQAQIDAYANEVEKRALDYSNSAGATAKLILTAVTSGRNPRCFGAPGEELDLPALLDTYYDRDSGQYGTTSFDHALALMAVEAAGRNAPRRARNFALTHRGANGWNFAMTKAPGDDVDTTAMVILGLRAAGVPRSNAQLKAGLRWLRLQRNRAGGYHPGGEGQATQANSTALAAMAGRSMGYAERRTLKELRTLQQSDGSFGNFRRSPGKLAYRAVATVEALVAVSGAKRPVRVRTAPSRSAC